jgi:hypothetical protein
LIHAATPPLPAIVPARATASVGPSPPDPPVPPALPLQHIGNFHTDTLPPALVQACGRRVLDAWRTYRGYPASGDAPMKKDARPSQPLAGSAKRCRVWDSAFVTLSPAKPGQRFPPPQWGDRMGPLRHLESLVFNRVIHRSLMIAPYAGPNLWEFCRQGQSVDIDAFRPAAADLHAMHTLKERGGAFARDIKPENACVLPGPDPQVRIIDFEQDVVFGEELKYLRPRQYRGTELYQTAGLVDGVFKGPAALRPAHACAADDYAFTMTLIFATAAPGSALRKAVSSIEYSPTGNRYPGVMHAGNAALFDPWIEQHVLPPYRTDIRALLTDPAAFAVAQPQRTPLVEMIRFSTAHAVAGEPVE